MKLTNVIIGVGGAMNRLNLDAWCMVVSLPFTCYAIWLWISLPAVGLAQ